MGRHVLLFTEQDKTCYSPEIGNSIKDVIGKVTKISDAYVRGTPAGLVFEDGENSINVCYVLGALGGWRWVNVSDEEGKVVNFSHVCYLGSVDPLDWLNKKMVIPEIVS